MLRVLSLSWRWDIACIAPCLDDSLVERIVLGRSTLGIIQVLGDDRDHLTSVQHDLEQPLRMVLFHIRFPWSRGRARHGK